MVVRHDLLQGIKADMHTWFYESAEKMYKKLDRIYDKVVEVLPVSEIKGGYWKGTSAIGAKELEDRVTYGKLYEDKPTEGFQVYAVIKDKALKVKCPRELKRDWHRTSDWLRDYVKQNWPQAVEITKEKIVANLFNYGGYTAGHAVFNNDDSDLDLTTYTNPNLCYDGKPMFNLAGNVRTAKSGSTYYNALALTGVTYANAVTMYNLLTSTNAYMENGQPFDNSQDTVVLCHPSLKLDWEIINNSTLNPDNANNPSNPLKGAFKIYSNPYLTSSTFSCMISQGKGVRFWTSEPKFDFWEENDPPTYWASVILDYAICIWNFRPLVGNNAPTS